MIINVALILILLQLVLSIKATWKFRKILTSFAIGVDSVLLILFWANLNSALINCFLTLVAVFSIINFARVFYGRTNIDHLIRAYRKTAFWLTIMMSVLYLCAVNYRFIESGFDYLGIMQALVALIIFASTLYSIFRARGRNNKTFLSDKELPTVSVCVPARNETTELESCLNSLLASTYPKLEIIVLDDCSSDTTPDVIRNFAQHGVRFIRGNIPDDDWLPKNAAYDRLCDEATGEFVLFCGVDTKLSPTTITNIVSMSIERQLDMISILPRRLASSYASAIIQPMRYWWELTIPRWGIVSPAVLGTCWLVNRKKLTNLGGFSSVKQTILPERYFAKQFARNNSYQFLIASDQLDVQTIKPIQEQRSTAVRVRYPQVHKRPELVLLIAVFEAFFLLAPFLGLLNSLLTQNKDIGLYVVTVCLLIMTHLSVVIVSNPVNVPVALLNFPIVVLTELYLGLESMLKYEFSTVTWKERNICLPVMHVYDKLPKIS